MRSGSDCLCLWTDAFALQLGAFLAEGMRIRFSNAWSTDVTVLQPILDDAPRLASLQRYSDAFADLCSYCLTKDPHKRPKYDSPPIANPTGTLLSLLEHPFIKEHSQEGIEEQKARLKDWRDNVGSVGSGGGSGVDSNGSSSGGVGGSGSGSGSGGGSGSGSGSGPVAVAVVSGGGAGSGTARTGSVPSPLSVSGNVVAASAASAASADAAVTPTASEEVAVLSTASANTAPVSEDGE